MTEPDRPHCRTPEACKAKGDRHCRGCIGAKNMAEIKADPMRVAARRAKAAIGRDTPQYRAARRACMKRLHRDPEIKAKMVAAGRQNAFRNFVSPEMRAKGEAARRRNDAMRTAKRVGIPLSLVGEFRALRHRRFPVDEIVAVLRGSHPAAFAAMDAAALGPLGPAPAIGMPDRAAWTQRANAIRAGVV